MEKKTSKSEARKNEIARARDDLNKWLERAHHVNHCNSRAVRCPEVNMIIESVSSSGMSRNIKCYVVVDGEMINISRLVAVVTCKPFVRGAVHIVGCGMDMGFALACELSWVLYHDEYMISHRWV